MNTSSPIPYAVERSWAELVEPFLAEKERGGSPATSAVYARLLRRFVRVVAKSPELVTPMDVHGFAFGVGCEPAQVPAPATINLRLAAVGGLFAFGHRMGCLAHDPAAALPRARVQLAAPHGLSVAEVQRLLAVIPSTAVGHRDRALVMVSLVTGLRRTELVNLTVHELERDGSLRCAVRGKGGHQRTLHLPAPLVGLMTAGAPCDGSFALEPHTRLFDIAASTWYSHLHRYAEVAGLGSLGPHVLRHTAARLRRQSGASLEEVSVFLGHASLATTSVYLRRLEGTDDLRWQSILALLTGPEPTPAAAVARARWPSRTPGLVRAGARHGDPHWSRDPRMEWSASLTLAGPRQPRRGWPGRRR